MVENSLNFDQIDKLLGEWQQKAGMVSQNLLDLHDMSVYQRLSAIDVRQHLPEPMKHQVNGAIDQVDQLFEYFDLLRDALEQAKNLRKQAGAFGAQDQLATKIEDLLTTQWIAIAQQQVPLAQRGLVSPTVNGDFLSLDQLLAIMTRLFQEAVAIFTKIERVEQNLGQDLQSARQLLHNLNDLQLINSDVCQEAELKCGKVGGNSIDPTELTTLIDWLHNLETKFGRGEIQTVAIALQNWLEKATKMLKMEQDTLNYHRGRLQLRLELRGRLMALKSKAVAKKRAEDPELINIAQQAENLLHHRPTPLDIAADLVVQYEQRLNS
jgi:hypothetical protein